MAEQNKKDSKGLGSFLTNFPKGINNDISPETQPEGTYRWALNAVIESEQGNLGFLSNEEGNYICGSIDPEWAIIGHVYIGEDEAIIFQAPKDTSLSSPRYGWGRISRIKSDCTVVNVITAACLNFKISHQIQATYRIRKGCEISIYYTDDYNRVGYINIDALEDYLAEGQEQYIADNPDTYMNDAYDGSGDPIWDCDKMSLFPDFSLPCIEFVRIDEGGTLVSGVYQFAIQYLDQDLNETRWTSITQPIPIYKDALSNSLSIKGDHPSQINPDGTVDFIQTTKSIVLNFTNLDESYSYIRVAVVASTFGIGASQGATIVDTIPFTGTSTQYNFTEIPEATSTVVPLDQITIPRQTFQKAKTITQLENRLILGNVEDTQIDHIELTKAALDIQVTYVTRELGTDNPNVESVQSGRYYFDYRSYMRDEIYAFGIVWVFKDGSESPVYHIPGRKKDKKADGTDMIPSAGEDPNVPHATGYDATAQAQHNRELPSGLNPDGDPSWDSTGIIRANNMNTDHYEPANPTDTHVERWEVYNTAIREQIITESNPTNVPNNEERKFTKGQLAYYECRDDEYPDVRDCNGVPIFPYTGTGTDVDPYVMDKVRHHKMPDTTLEPHFYGNVRIGTSRIGYMGDNPHDWNNSYDRSYIVTLGIEVNNVNIPESIADKIQGYRIVKALATSSDKTVIDKGIMYNIHYGFNSWKGDNVNQAISPCSYAFQGNRFNKQLGEFACVHATTTRRAKANEFQEAGTGGVFPDKQGSVNIATDNYYCGEFGDINFGYGGFVPRYTRFSECRTSGVTELDNLSWMAPLIVQDDWQNWYGCATFGTFGIANESWRGLNDLRNPSATSCNSPSGGPYRVQDKMYKGVGYPLCHWGWFHPERSPDYAATVGIEESDGVNIGYSTNVFSYPNSPMGYHGPLSKFKKIEEATYVKTERVLIGYSQNIICNNACCDNDRVDTSDPENMDGIGIYIGGRNDGLLGGCTYIYSKIGYMQSAVPYNNIQEGYSVANSQYDRVEPPCSYQPISSSVPTDPAVLADYNTWKNENREKSIWEVQSARYSFPLQNVRLSNYAHIDAFTEEVNGLNDILGPGISFTNHSQQELLIMGFSWRGTDPLIRWAWPWPGNNFLPTGSYNNYTRIPYDHAYSRFNCAQLYDRWENTQYAEPPYTTAITGPPEQLDSADPNYIPWYDLDGNVYKYPLNGIGTTYYVSLKKNAYNAYGNIFSLTYTTTHNCIVRADENTPGLSSSKDEIYGGDSFISRFAFKQTQEGARTSQKVINTEATGPTCSDRGHFIQPLNTSTGLGLNNLPAVFENLQYAWIEEGKTQTREGNFNHIVEYWAESYINTELRLGNAVFGEFIYPYHFEGNNSLYGVSSFVDDAQVQFAGAGYADENTGPQSSNYYALNEDYNKAATESTFSPLPLQFDYCSDCSNKHPHRISYSDASMDNEQSDAFRNFLTGNYRDIPGNRGEIWNIWPAKNALHIHTEESLWRVDPSRQMLQPEGDSATVYLGTGAFFSNPPREMSETELGYLGCKSQWATSLTPAGPIWPDEQQGRVHMLQQMPRDISAIGLRSWFENNMRMNIYDQYQNIYGVEFPFIDNPANPVGAGFISIYDNQYKRYILSKKDYKLTGDFADPTTPFYKSIVLDPLLNEWVIVTSPCNCPDNPEWVALADPGSYNASEVTVDGVKTCEHTWTINSQPFTNYWPCEYSKLTGNDGSSICRTCGDNNLISPITIQGIDDERSKIVNNLNEVFECDSWTISFNASVEHWVSFHSYFPNYYIGVRNYFYSYLTHDVNLYKHDLNATKTNYQTFYGCTDPFIIDFINNDTPLNANIYDTLRYNTEVSYYNATTKEYVDDRYTTFNRAWLYNSYQTTGELNLFVKDETILNMMPNAVTQVQQQSLLKRKDRAWHLNHFRDIAKDRTQASVPTLFTNEWTSLSTTPYLDKVINPLAIDSAKAWYENQPLKGRYLQVRLFFDNLAGDPASGKYKMTASYVLGFAQHSPR